MELLIKVGAAPALIDLCYAGAARKKNAFAEEQKQIESENKDSPTINHSKDINNRYPIQR